MSMQSSSRLVLLFFLHSYAFDRELPTFLGNIMSESESTVPESNYYVPHKHLRGPSFSELAARYGHPAEEYEVTTEDGHKLTVFRLPGRRKALPVLLFHGLADSSDTWILRGNTSIAITLANARYDVWLANNRGNRYSRGHSYLSPSDERYWNFTFNEIGTYDLPATIDLILKHTGARKLNAFGHSQGNTIFYVLLSTRPEYNAKVNVLAALAPVCYVHNIPEPMSILIKHSKRLQRYFGALSITSLLGDDTIHAGVLRSISQIPVIGYAIEMKGMLFEICGIDEDELEPEFLSVAGLHFPTWVSVKNLAHFAQLGLRREFARYDYGFQGNVVAYNSIRPPEYDLSKVKTRVVLLAARNDKLSMLEDVAILRRRLPNVVRYVVNPRQEMNHLDYVWGRTAPTYLYKYIFEVLETYR